jgi:aminoglycoside phosphotransferase (APT) family kinase protein
MPLAARRLAHRVSEFRATLATRGSSTQVLGGRLVLHDRLRLMSVTVVGFDAPAVEAWLHTVTEVVLPLSWTRLPGGHSNLTYLLTDSAGRELVLRRPPMGELLPKAHDMWREYRIIEALWPTAVPVAEPIAFCDDRAVADAHFYVMGKASGRVLHTGTAAVDWLNPPARARAGESFIDALAALHSLDPEALELQDLGRPDAYVARQLSAWHRSWTSQVDSARHDDPRIHQLHELLTARTPVQGSARIVHGDYGPHNTLFDQSGDVTAVLDWELATLGDPLADLGYCINSWVEPGEFGAYGADPATAQPGFPSRQDLIARYERATGADLGQLAYYRAFNWWKLACIIHGVYARYMEAKKSTEGVDLPDLFRRMGSCVDAAEQQAALI